MALAALVLSSVMLPASARAEEAEGLGSLVGLYGFPASRGIVLGDHMVWRRKPHWVAPGAGTPLARILQADEGHTFTIGEAGKQAIWCLPLALPIDSRVYPVLHLRYRASGIDTSSPDALLSVLTLVGGDLTPSAVLSPDQVTADGETRDIEVDLSVLTHIDTVYGVVLQIAASPSSVRPCSFDLRYLCFLRPDGAEHLDQPEQIAAFEVSVSTITQQPVAGATVVTDAERVNFARAETTDEQGHAWVSGIHNESYGHSLRVERSGYVPVKIPELPKGGGAVTVVLPEAQSWGGIVTDAQGAPLPGVRIGLRPVCTLPIGQQMAVPCDFTTDEQGRWTADAVPAHADRYQLSFTAPGRAAVQLTVLSGSEEALLLAARSHEACLHVAPQGGSRHLSLAAMLDEASPERLQAFVLDPTEAIESRLHALDILMPWIEAGEDWGSDEALAFLCRLASAERTPILSDAAVELILRHQRDSGEAVAGAMDGVRGCLAPNPVPPELAARLKQELSAQTGPMVAEEAEATRPGRVSAMARLAAWAFRSMEERRRHRPPAPTQLPSTEAAPRKGAALAPVDPTVNRQEASGASAVPGPVPVFLPTAEDGGGAGGPGQPLELSSLPGSHPPAPRQELSLEPIPRRGTTRPVETVTMAPRQIQAALRVPAVGTSRAGRAAPQPVAVAPRAVAPQQNACPTPIGRGESPKPTALPVLSATVGGRATGELGQQLPLALSSLPVDPDSASPLEWEPILPTVRSLEPTKRPEAVDATPRQVRVATLGPLVESNVPRRKPPEPLLTAPGRNASQGGALLAPIAPTRTSEVRHSEGAAVATMPVSPPEDGDFVRRSAAVRLSIARQGMQDVRELLRTGKTLEAQEQYAKLVMAHADVETACSELLGLGRDVFHAPNAAALVDMFLACYNQVGSDGESVSCHVARYCYQRCEYDLALRQCRAYLDAFAAGARRSKVHLTLGLCLTRLGRHEDAVAALRQLTAEHRDSDEAPAAQFLIGWLHVTSQDYAAARRDLALVIDRYPQTNHARKARELIARLPGE